VRADQDGLLRTLNLMGAIGFERGDLETASDRFEQALEVARSLGDRLMTARALNNTASVMHLRGDAETALSRYREALLVYQSSGDRRGAAETYHNLGLVYREAGEVEEAERMAEHAVRHATLARTPGLLSLALTGRAEIALARGDAALAQEALDRAEVLAAQAEDAPGQAEILRVRALVALNRGQLNQAVEWSGRAGKLARELGILLLEAESAVVAGRALARLARRDEAAQKRSEAADLFRRLGAAAHLSRLEAES
jgi:tetratricopeptide (TPR) repeat protein